MDQLDEPDVIPEITPLDRAIGEYLLRVDAGETISRGEFLAMYSDLRDELQLFFADHDRAMHFAGGTEFGQMIDTSIVALAGTVERPTSWINQIRRTEDRKETSATFPGPFPVQFGQYAIRKMLGRGAMGEVYLAEDGKLGRQVALKVPRRSADESPEFLERFYREARACAKLRHQNICPIYEVNAIGDTHYIAMAFIDGQPLSRSYFNGSPNSERLAATIRKISLALDVAHRAGVVHRDLKPSNIMIDTDGEPIVMDFGLAQQSSDVESRITQEGTIVGTPAYMSPEQVRCEYDRVGPASDVYSLGVILYELLTGRLPHTGPLMSMMVDVVNETKSPPKPSTIRPGVDPALEAVCCKMLSKTIEGRYQSMKEVAAALDVFREGAGVREGEAPAEPRKTGKIPRTHGSAGASPSLFQTAARAKYALMLLGVVLLGGIVFKLKTKNFELTVTVPDAAPQTNDRLGQETDRNTKQLTTPSVEHAAQPPSDMDPNRRAVQLLRAWDTPPRIELSTGEVFEPHTPRDHPLPKEPFKIRDISLIGTDVDRFGDGLADVLVETLRDVHIEGHLVLSTHKLSTAGLAKLVRLPAFAELSNLSLKGDELDDGLFAEVAKLPKLSNLDIGSCRKVTGKGLSALQSLPNFGLLTMVYCSVSANGLKELRTLPHLGALNLSATTLTDAHVDELAATSIEQLILGSTGIDDLQVERLLRNQSLTRLVLTGNDKVTDKLLPTLKQQTQLRSIDFSATSVTEAAAAQLQQALPKCKVVWNPVDGQANAAPPTTSRPAPDGPKLVDQKDAEALAAGDYEWTEPENLGPSINSFQPEMLFGVSDDERTIYFLRDNQLMSCQRPAIGQPFTEQQDLKLRFDLANVGTVSSQELFVISTKPRPDVPTFRELWMSSRTRVDEPFGDMIRMPSPVNTSEDATHPILSADAKTLLITSNRPPSSGDIWMLTRESLDQPFGNPERLTEPVSTPFWDMPFWVSNDRQTMIVASQRRERDRELREFRFVTHATSKERLPKGTPFTLPFGKTHPSEKCYACQLSPNRQSLYFCVLDLPGGHGVHDIWNSRLRHKPANARQPSEK